MGVYGGGLHGLRFPQVRHKRRPALEIWWAHADRVVRASFSGAATPMSAVRKATIDPIAIGGTRDPASA